MKEKKKQDITFILYCHKHKLNEKINKIAYEKNIPVKDITFRSLINDKNINFIVELYECKI